MRAATCPSERILLRFDRCPKTRNSTNTNTYSDVANEERTMVLWSNYKNFVTRFCQGRERVFFIIVDA